MEWYTGGIANAIATCRQRKALFIVYVHDDSTVSQSTLEVWNSTEVQDVLKANSYVAVRVLKDSIESQQFSQLFVVFMYPSVFCIGMNGKSLVVMNGEQTASQMSSKLTDAFQKLSSELEGGSSQTTPPVSQATVTPEVGVATTEVGGAGEAEEDQEEKLQKYRDAIRRRTEEREREEGGREKQEEVERRSQGQDHAETQRLRVSVGWHGDQPCALS